MGKQWILTLEVKMNTKFKLRTDLSINHCGKILYRIEALGDFGNVKKGDLGGYLEKEENLSQDRYCWVSGNARVYGNAWVYGDARVYGDAWVSGNASVSGNARVSGNAWVYGNARVYDDAWVYGNSSVRGYDEISSELHIITISGFTYPITVTPMSVHIGCKDFTFDQLDEVFGILTSQEEEHIKAMVEIAVDRIYGCL